MSAAIDTAGLTKTYGSIHALSDLDLVVEEGQCFGFLGPNGAGKTTTIRLLLALQHPTSGEARVLGLDAQRDSIEVHRRVGYLPGDLALYPRLTGRHHVERFAAARGDVDLSFAAALARRFDVVLDQPVRELSTGNRQKIGLVLAFMAHPQVLLLDEPTAGLDPLMQDEFEKLVRETVAEGRTVFLSSHELDEVQRLADRVAIIRRGRLLATDTVEHLRQTAPQKVEVRFVEPEEPDAFSRLSGVTVTSSEGPRLTMEVTGAIGPLLRTIADRDPVDVIVRHADLDELFLEWYRDEDHGDGERVRPTGPGGPAEPARHEAEQRAEHGAPAAHGAPPTQNVQPAEQADATEPTRAR